MAIVKCENNHYYDDVRDETCPYCEKMNSRIFESETLNEQLTSYMFIEDGNNVQLTEAYGEDVCEYEKTIGIFTDENQNLLTVGWLVCMNGIEKGKSYPVYSGRNFAGRSIDMDIVLSDDSVISRENHFSIVYDPKSITFYLVAGEGRTYLNGEHVQAGTEITDGDEISVGESRYIFTPFCKKGRVW